MNELEYLLIKSSIEQKATRKWNSKMLDIVMLMLMGIALNIFENTVLEVLTISQIIACLLGIAIFVIGVVVFIAEKWNPHPDTTGEDLLQKLQMIKEKGATAEEAIKELGLLQKEDYDESP